MISKPGALYGPQDFQRDFNLASEMMAPFDVYAALLQRWQRHHNLVGAATIADLWRRHFMDSLQLAAFAPDARAGGVTWIDMGAGAGFPGLPLAIYFRQLSGFRMYLVESNGKKCSFLREAIRLTGAPATLVEQRIERLSPADFAGPVEVISARAFAPLPRLFELADAIRSPQTKFLLLKGQDVDKELTNTAKCWNIRTVKHRSRADPAGCVLEITEVARA